MSSTRSTSTTQPAAARRLSRASAVTTRSAPACSWDGPNLLCWTSWTTARSRAQYPDGKTCRFRLWPQPLQRARPLTRALSPGGGEGAFGGSDLLRGGGQGAGGGGRAVGLEEGADVAQRDRDLLRVRLPRIEAHLRVRGQVDGLDRNRVGVRRNVVGQHQDGGPALTHEVARHGEHEIGVLAVHVFEKGAGLLHRDIGAAFAQ